MMNITCIHFSSCHYIYYKLYISPQTQASRSNYMHYDRDLEERINKATFQSWLFCLHLALRHKASILKCPDSLYLPIWYQYQNIITQGLIYSSDRIYAYSTCKYAILKSQASIIMSRRPLIFIFQLYLNEKVKHFWHSVIRNQLKQK